MNSIDKQKENLNHLMMLIKNNPDLPLYPMVDSEIVSDDSFSWWLGRWGSSSIEDVWNNDERIYIRSEDEYQLIEDLWDSMESNGLDDDQLRQLAKEEVEQYPWKTVITVKINNF